MHSKVRCKMGFATTRNGITSEGRLHYIKSFKLASDQSKLSQIELSSNYVLFLTHILLIPIGSKRR